MMTPSETLAYEAGYRNGYEDAQKESVPKVYLAQRLDWLAREGYLPGCRNRRDIDPMIWNTLMHGIPEMERKYK